MTNAVSVYIRIDGACDADRPVWIITEPSTEIQGVWQAHCLELDIVEQGATMCQAFDAAKESAAITMEQDALDGRDPYRRRAPQKFWDRLDRILAEDQARRSTTCG